MKTETAIKNLEKAVEKLNARRFRNVKATKAWELIHSAIKTGNHTIRPTEWKGRGRHISLADHYYDCIVILEAAKIRYNACNDAPRGGKEGNYIILTHINY